MSEQSSGPMYMLTSGRLTAPQEWERDLRALIDEGRSTILSAQRLSLLAQTNDITGVIVGSADGAELEGTTIKKEDAAARAAIFDELMAWLMQQATGQPEGVTRLAIIFRRF